MTSVDEETYGVPNISIALYRAVLTVMYGAVLYCYVRGRTVQSVQYATVQFIII